ncbi:AaceriADL265Wp [[Ashbya] aceris (nom. inval.)]|nr:AaceriADL265Wp [[Ashbya] aceris (nom. inval.)]
MAERDPLQQFERQFEEFVKNNPNVLSAARSASRIPESAKAVIVLSPLSLQHKFPRYWVSKSYKKSIVERPERILASSLGIAAAITMYPALFTLKSSHHRQTSLLSPHVLRVHGNDWPKAILRLCKLSDDRIQKKQLEVPDEWNVGDIYLCRGTIEALQGSIGALECGVDSIFDGPSTAATPNRAFVALRPPGHHAHTSTPSGFCLFNNAHIAVEYAASRYGVTHAAILDFDLHHGDGTQDICWKRAGFKPDDEVDNAGEYDEFGKRFAEFPKVGYFSLHDINSFPTEQGYAHKPSIKDASICVMDSHDVNIWNIHLAAYETEEEFNKLYQTKYRAIFAKADEFLRVSKKRMEAEGKNYKGLVIISAGFDASEHEQLSMQRHGVHVPTSFYCAFTKDALKLAQMHTQGKLLSLLEGGYSDAALVSGIFSHLIGMQNQNWIAEWGSDQVIKEVCRGCRPNWKAYKTKRSRDVIRNWAEEVIKLGRSMIPEFQEAFFVDAAGAEPPAARMTRSKHKQVVAKLDSSNLALRSDTPSPPERKTLGATKVNAHVRYAPVTAPPVNTDSEEEEEDDYVYDEALNRTFNRTVEDITVDDISKHLETLEIIQEPVPSRQHQGVVDAELQHDTDTNANASTKYRVPQLEPMQRVRRMKSSRPPNIDDSDISMISHLSAADKRRTVQGSRNKW